MDDIILDCDDDALDTLDDLLKEHIELTEDGLKWNNN